MKWKIPNIVSTSVVAVALAAVFVEWNAGDTAPSIHSITTPRQERCSRVAAMAMLALLVRPVTTTDLGPGSLKDTAAADAMDDTQVDVGLARRHIGEVSGYHFGEDGLAVGDCRPTPRVHQVASGDEQVHRQRHDEAGSTNPVTEGAIRMNELVEYEGNPLTPVEDNALALIGEPGSFAKQDSRTADPCAAAPSGGHGRIGVAVLAASILAAVAVGAAAFGGGFNSSSARDASGAAKGSLSASVSNSVASQSVAFTVSATQKSASSVTTLLTGSGSVDLSRDVGQMTASIPALSTYTSGLAGGSVQVVSDGSNVYVQVPALSTLTGGKSWFETSMAGTGSKSGTSGGSLSLSALTDPVKALAMLGSLGAPVTKVGAVQLDGTPTTEHKTTISGAELVAELEHNGHGSSPSTGAAVKALHQLGLVSVPVTAWVGQDGYVRQVSVAIDLSHATLGGLLGGLFSSTSATATGAGSVLVLTVGFSRYGSPVSVTVPPPSDVTNLDGIMSSVNGGFSNIGGALGGMASKV